MASNVNANSGNIYKYCDTCGEALFLGTSHSCELLVNMVKKAIAARDKWWMEQIEKLGGYYPTGDTDLDLLEEINISYEQWQSLKQSLEVKE